MWSIIDLLYGQRPLCVFRGDVYGGANNEIHAYKAKTLSKSGIGKACLGLIVTGHT